MIYSRTLGALGLEYLLTLQLMQLVQVLSPSTLTLGLEYLLTLQHMQLVQVPSPSPSPSAWFVSCSMRRRVSQSRAHLLVEGGVRRAVDMRGRTAALAAGPLGIPIGARRVDPVLFDRAISTVGQSDHGDVLARRHARSDQKR